MSRPRKSIVYRRGDSPFWWYTWTVEGHRFRGSTGETEKALAESIALDIRRNAQAQIRLGLPVKTEITLQQAMTKAWEEHFQYLSRSDATWAHIASLTRKRPNAALHGGVLVSNIDKPAVSDYVARRRGEYRGQWRKTGRPEKRVPISPTTINDELTCLATCLSMARGWKINGASVAVSDVDVRECRLDTTKHVHTVLPNDFQDAFFDNLIPHAVPPFCMYLYTGLRKSNIVGEPGLHWQTIDLYADRPHARIKIKGGKMHTVWLPPAAVQLLEYLEPDRNKRFGPVFKFGNERIACDCSACKTRPGEPIKDMRRTLNTARKAIGLPDLNIHDLRHKVGRTLVREWGLKVAQQALGHADIATTAAFYADQDQKFVAQAVSDSLGGLSRFSHADEEAMEAKSA